MLLLRCCKTATDSRQQSCTMQRVATSSAALLEYRKALPAESNLLVYYAGHGARDPETHDAYWMPVDAKPDNPANWISAEEIIGYMRAMPSRHVILVSDSCFSGALANAVMRGMPVSLPPRETDAFFEKKLRDKSRTILSSGGDEPVADNGGKGHSIFALAMLDGLSEMDENRFTATELYAAYVDRKVGGNSNQDPHYLPLARSGDNGGDFVFTRVSIVKAPATAATYEGAQKIYRGGDYPAAFSPTRLSAMAGDARSMTALGDMYSAGKGAVQNPLEAGRWWRKAADAGNADAMDRMGSLYFNGIRGYGVERDVAEGVRWFRKGADLGNTTSMFKLGRMYDGGQGVAVDYAEAARWFRKGAEAGDILSMKGLAVHYERGLGVELSRAQALAWYQRAASLGDQDAEVQVRRLQ